MTQKPEIQYVGQFYVYGSEAKEAALKDKIAKFRLPKPKMEKIQKIYVDPVATVGIVVALILLVTMAVGAVKLKESMDHYAVVQNYLTEVKRENARIEHEYHRSFDIEHIQSAAEGMGMIPAGEAKTIKLKVTMPEPKAEPTVWDNFLWFVRGLVD